MLNKKPDPKRRDFIKKGSIIAAGLVFSHGRTTPLMDPSLTDGPRAGKRVKDVFSLNRRAVVRGYLGEKLTLSYQNRILAQDDENLIAPFRHRTETHLWQSEFWGKWFTSAVLAYQYHPTDELKGVLDRAVTGLMATQTSEGYIGNYAPANRLDQWDIWGMKYCMMGLLDYHALTGDGKSLASAVKLADYLMSELRRQHKLIVQTGNYRGMASSSVLGAICRLYLVTQEKRFLEFAEKIVSEWETDAGPQLIRKATVNVSERFPKPKQWYSPEQGQKAYEMMSCYEGLLDLYRITGNEKYKTAAIKTWDNIRETEINLVGSGASAECWFGGKPLQAGRVYHYQETCVSVTWIRLSLNLLKLTGESKYADAIERTYFNALLGSMYPDGSDWAKYTPLTGQRRHGSGQCGMDLNCCNANGPRGLFLLPAVAVMKSDQGAFVNFYTGGTFHLTSPKGQNMAIEQQTDYPVSGNIDLAVDLPEEEDMTIGVRVPAWSKQSRLSVNGNTLTAEPGDYTAIKRRWKKGDRISLVLDMRGRVEYLGDKMKFAAVTRGPVVLARDARYAGNQIINAVMPVTDPEGYINLSPVKEKDQSAWIQFEAPFLPESYTEEGAKPVSITLIDYSSAGYTEKSPTYCVWTPQIFDPKQATG